MSGEKNRTEETSLVIYCQIIFYGDILARHDFLLFLFCFIFLLCLGISAQRDDGLLFCRKNVVLQSHNACNLHDSENNSYKKKCSLQLFLFYLRRHQNFQEAQTRQKKRIKTKTNKLILFSVKKKHILPLVERYMMNKITHRG